MAGNRIMSCSHADKVVGETRSQLRPALMKIDTGGDTNKTHRIRRDTDILATHPACED